MAGAKGERCEWCGSERWPCPRCGKMDCDCGHSGKICFACSLLEDTEGEQ